MTDRDKLIELLNSFGVGFKEAVGEMTIVLLEGSSKIIGHNGLFTEFRFYDDGGFLEVGVWN